MRARSLLVALASTAILGTMGCGQANSPVAQTTPQGVASSGGYSVQQESGTTTCLRRYRLCLRTLAREIGSDALSICQERRDRCIDALGEGFFIRR